MNTDLMAWNTLRHLPQSPHTAAQGSIVLCNLRRSKSTHTHQHHTSESLCKFIIRYNYSMGKTKIIESMRLNNLAHHVVARNIPHVWKFVHTERKRDISNFNLNVFALLRNMNISWYQKHSNNPWSRTHFTLAGVLRTHPMWLSISHLHAIFHENLSFLASFTRSVNVTVFRTV